MSDQQPDFSSQEAFVRRILFARQCRMERSEAAKVKATIGVALAMMRDGRMPSRKNAVDYCDPSRLDMWLLSLGWALAYVGTHATYIMQAHLLNRPKSTASSWRQIADDLEVPRADVQQIYVSAIPIFVAILEEREIKENIDDIDDYLDAVAAPYRCAAKEAGDRCPVVNHHVTARPMSNAA